MSREYQSRSFFDDEDTARSGRSDDADCPDDYQCTKLHGKPQNVCCPLPSKTEPEDIIELDSERKQSSKQTYVSQKAFQNKNLVIGFFLLS